MAQFRLWCRAQDIGESQFLATVSAIPEQPADASHLIQSESRLLATHELALAALQEMSEAMRERLERRGYEVVGMEAV